jgi:two-component system response regulator VicR
MKRRILIVEDDRSLAKILAARLAIEGYEVECVADGSRAPGVATAFAPDLIMLDVSLPGKDGFELCRQWRATKQIPIIMLTARSDKVDKLRGLNVGADDYITKPFDFQEVLARILAVLRRTRPAIDHVRLGTVVVDFQKSLATNRGRAIELTRREFDLLHYLAERAGSIVSRDELLRAIWGYEELPSTARAVDQAIVRLRKKIEPNQHEPQYLHTAHGDGYYLTPDPFGENPS